MKLKILAVPVLIVLIIIFSIWIIEPAYSLAIEKKGAYLKSIEKVNDISSKLENAKKLSEELSQMGDEKKVVTEYLPENNQEEYVINYFNDLVLKEGMSIISLTLSQKMTQPAAPVFDEFGNVLTEIDTTPLVKYVDVDFSVAGNYDKVKSFLKKMNNLKRFNNISTIKIVKGSSETESSAQSDGLIVSAVSSFGYLEKMATVTNINNLAISGDKLDLSVIDRIIGSKNTDSSALQIDSAGKENLFLR